MSNFPFKIISLFLLACIIPYIYVVETHLIFVDIKTNVFQFVSICFNLFCFVLFCFVLFPSMHVLFILLRREEKRREAMRKRFRFLLEKIFFPDPERERERERERTIPIRRRRRRRTTQVKHTIHKKVDDSINKGP